MEKHVNTGFSGAWDTPSVSVSREVGNAWGIRRTIDVYNASSVTSLFSSSLPVLPHDKLNFADSENDGHSVDDGFPVIIKHDKEDLAKDPFEDVEPIGIFLPGDEDELLAGIMDDFDLSGLPTQLEDLEGDLFDSGGGMEMDFESQEGLLYGITNLSVSDGDPGNGMGHYGISNGGGTFWGEHPFGEHPSRTLFVRNINSNVEDSELRSLFEQYGDIRTLYTACKHRGFVMISYYDIRDARTAMRSLQNKPLRRRKLDIHFSIPKDNPSEKDINQGTLVIFNLDASVSNDDLRQIFGAYGELKEIRETPHKKHHKFIEFYDVRAAEAALKALNRSDIAGKSIKLEPSRPGGARRNLIQQLSQELEQDETRTFRHHVGSPVANSPPGSWTHLSSPVDLSPVQGLGRSPGLESSSPMNGNHLPRLASLLPIHASNPVKIALGTDHATSSHINQINANNTSMQGFDYQKTHLFPEQKLSASTGHTFVIGDSNLNSSGTPSGPQFLWGSPTLYADHTSSSSWEKPLVGSLSGQGKDYPCLNRHGTYVGSLHHVRSAPSGIPPERHFGSFPGSPETAFLNPVTYGGFGSTGSYMTNVAARGCVDPLHYVIGSRSPSSQMMVLPRNGPILFGNGIVDDMLTERVRTRRLQYPANHVESRKQYQLDLDKIVSGEDTRTTLMIKNIPNKYTSKMLLAAIDENHKGTYDFLYLPIDFKNKCNVGYAFINMASPTHIISFYQVFSGKKWEKFNSEKVASLAYARIQGRGALVSHFQNSSLMNEDKCCRPILFQSEGQETSDREPFYYNNLNACIHQADGSYSGDSLASPTSNPEN